MPIFGPDPKDEVIAVLKEEVVHLRGLLAERDKTILAMTSTHAFRLVHGEEAPQEQAKSTPDPYTLRATDYQPPKTQAEVENEFPAYSRPPKDS